MKLTLFLFILFLLLLLRDFGSLEKVNILWYAFFGWMFGWVENISVLSYISKRDKHINVTS